MCGVVFIVNEDKDIYSFGSLSVTSSMRPPET